MEPVATVPPAERLAAFGAVFKAHLRDVMRTARCLGATRAEVDDIAQETFLALFEAMASGRYDLSRPARPWLRTTAYRIARRDLKKRAPLVLVGDAEPIDHAALEDIMSAEERPEVKHRWAVVLELLAALEPERRIVYVMTELDEMTAAEIAAILEIPAKTVSTRLGLARRDVAAALARKRARDRSEAGNAGALIVPLEAASVLRPLRDLPAPEVSAEQQARIWRWLQRVIPALLAPVPAMPAVTLRPSAPLPSPSLPRMASRRLVVCMLVSVFVFGVGVGLLVALLTFLRPSFAPNRSAVVYSSAPLETAALTPGAALPTAAMSAPLLTPTLPASSVPERAARKGQSEGWFLGLARRELQKDPPHPAAALEALAARARIFGAKTPLAGEAAEIQQQAEALRRASSASKP